MDTHNLVIKNENVFTTFFIGWQSFLIMFRTTFRATIRSLLGQLFGILMVSLAPILEFREMIDISSTPDGWLYILLSVFGIGIFVHFLWRFFLILAAVNLFARDIYDNRAIANLSFYISDVNRKKWSYFRFLMGYLSIALFFSAVTATIMYLAQKLVVYNFMTGLAGLILVLIQSAIFLGYILFSNIAIQGYVFNRIIGLSGIVGRVLRFIKENFIPLTILSFVTVFFSNVIAYVVQILTGLIIINPFGLYGDNSVGIAIRFTLGFIANGFVLVLLQYIYSRLYLVSEDREKMY